MPQINPFRPDSRIPEAKIVLRDFGGLVTKADPLDLPPGTARVQTNVMSTTPGELTVRPGIRQVQFEA